MTGYAQPINSTTGQSVVSYQQKLEPAFLRVILMCLNLAAVLFGTADVRLTAIGHNEGQLS
jgi:hypothetical protein